MNPTEIRIIPTQPAYFDALATLQSRVFAGLTAEELFTADHYRQHVQYFPEGQLLALADTDQGEIVVGSTTTLRTSETFDGDYGYYGYYYDFIGRGTLSTHDPQGEWLYGIDVGVHPDFRRMGIGRRLYDARRDLVRRLNLRGELVAGLLPGYPRYRDAMTVEEYAHRVAAAELHDSTLSMQIGVGFRLQKLLYNYVIDSRSNNVVTLLVRDNPDHV